MADDEGWSRLPEHWRGAFRQAWAAYVAGTIPVGAVVVDPCGVIAAEARNRIFDAGAPPRSQLAGSWLAHAELNAIAQIDAERSRTAAVNGRSSRCAGRSQSSPSCFWPRTPSRRVRRASPLHATASHPGARSSRPQASSSPGGETGARPSKRSWPRFGQPLSGLRLTPRATRPHEMHAVPARELAVAEAHCGAALALATELGVRPPHCPLPSRPRDTLLSHRQATASPEHLRIGDTMYRERSRWTPSTYPRGRSWRSGTSSTGRTPR